ALERWADDTRAQLPQLMALDGGGAYFIKSLDQDGVRHGDLSQPIHTYVDATVNIDALLYHAELLPAHLPVPSPVPGTPAWNSFALQSAIMATLVSLPGLLSEDGFMRL